MPNTLRLSTVLLLLFSAAISSRGHSSEFSAMQEFWRAARISSHFHRVKVASADELIAAMTAAASSGKPTLIHVAPGTYSFTQTFSSDFDLSVLPPVITTIVIDGGSAETTILDGTPAGEFSGARYFTVLKGGRLFLRNLALRDAETVCDMDDCSRDGGGAALNAGGDLWIDNCDLTSDFTLVSQGAGISFGGAILNVSGDLQIDHSHIDGNEAVGNGGGIALLGGTGSIRHSTVNGNTGGRENARNGGLNEGGGIYLINARLEIRESTISGNAQSDDNADQALSFGGGIYSLQSEVDIEDSAITENIEHSAGNGGGITNSGRMVIRNSTIGGNTAGSYGGGIANSGHLELQGVTLTLNLASSREIFDSEGEGVTFPTNCDPGPCVGIGGGIENEGSGTIRMVDTVIAGNLPASPWPDCDGVLITEGHNAIGNTAGCTLRHHGAVHDELNVNPELGPLQDDGVPGNPHYPPLANSPLIDAGGRVGVSCTLFDQIRQRRGRHDADTCDIGSIEYKSIRK